MDEGLVASVKGESCFCLLLHTTPPKPPSVKLLRSLFFAKSKSLPILRFEDQQLSSFAGLIVLIPLFKRLDLNRRFDACFRSIKTPHAYSFGLFYKVLIIHLILGYRKLREVSAYADDPIVRHVLGRDRVPSASTLSRMLKEIDKPSVEAVHDLNRRVLLDRLGSLQLSTVTLDFDGSVLSTARHAEGTAIGFNKRKKGQRSYYPLCCMIAQTGQVLDLHHRSGNVHDSNQAWEFIHRCVGAVREALPHARIEARLDSAFFSEELLRWLEQWNVEYTISVPFERLVALKEKIAARRWWHRLRGHNGRIDYFEQRWKPKSWRRKSRFLFVRTENPRARKGPLQLDLFEPRDWGHDYQVIVTNKPKGAASVVSFHHGRGSQEKIFAELKSQAAMEYIPARRWNANKLYLLANVMAHNLGRELQLEVLDQPTAQKAKRPALWRFEGWENLRRHLIQRAGRLIRPQGKLTLSLNVNPTVQRYFRKFLPDEIFT